MRARSRSPVPKLPREIGTNRAERWRYLAARDRDTSRPAVGECPRTLFSRPQINRSRIPSPTSPCESGCAKSLANLPGCTCEGHRFDAPLSRQAAKSSTSPSPVVVVQKVIRLALRSRTLCRKIAAANSAPAGFDAVRQFHTAAEVSAVWREIEHCKSDLWRQSKHPLSD